MSQLFGERSWQIPNRMEPAIAMAREAMEWVESFPISEQSKYSIRLTLEEMLSNTVKYGYDDSAEHLITIRIAADSELIRIELMDDGHPFDPTRQATPDVEHRIEEGLIGGFGIELVRRLCKQMDYQREADRNRTTLHIGILDPDEFELNDPQENRS